MPTTPNNLAAAAFQSWRHRFGGVTTAEGPSAHFTCQCGVPVIYDAHPAAIRLCSLCREARVHRRMQVRQSIEQFTQQLEPAP